MRRTGICIPFMVLVVVLCGLCPATINAQSGWARTIGGAAEEYLLKARATSDGGLIAAGATQSFGSGMWDMWVIKLDASGDVQWQETYGGAADEFGYSVSEMPDGGYVVVGDIGGNPNDLLVVKLDSTGAIEWQNSFGGADFEFAYDVQSATDGGIIVAGATYSFGAGTSDAWILKLDSSGTIQWQKVYGTADQDYFEVIQQTSDGGYIAAGETNPGGEYDLWVVKIDSMGALQWQNTYGIPGNDFTQGIRETSDSGFILLGSTTANGTSDIALLKLDSTGDIQWQVSYGGGNIDSGVAVQETSDGGFAVLGNTSSFGAGLVDAWLLRLDNLGHIVWQKTYGGTNNDAALSYDFAADGGLLIAGRASSFGAGDDDGWIMKLDPDGSIAPDCLLESDSLASPVVASLISSPGLAIEADSAATVTDLTNSLTITSAEILEQCGPPCLFCDEFDDDQLAADWTYAKPSWSEAGGDLIGTATKKALAIASPAFAGCTDCSFESSIMTTGGPGSKVSFFTWYTDKHNNVEILLKEGSDKVILKQRAGGILAKTKVALPILPGVFYNLQIAFDGTQFVLLVDGNSVATLTAVATPAGTVAFQSKGTAHFGRISVQ